LNRPFHARVNPLTNAVWVDKAVERQKLEDVEADPDIYKE